MRGAALAIALTISSAAFGEEPPGWQWRASAGAEVNPSTHGTVDLGVRRGPLALQLLTDTLELRYAPSWSSGNGWLAARGEAYDAGLLVAPWTNGAPDPTRALNASYVGLEAGWIRYLPHSIWGGIAGSARVYFFGKRDKTTIPVPGTGTLFSADLLFGRWSPVAQMYIRLGADVQGGEVQPHVAGEAIFQPQTTLAPRLELRAGAGYHQSFLTRTRLGGLNPYVVPLAGAGWAEFWVEDYAAARLALIWSTPITDLGAALDAAAFDNQVATGLALLAGAHYGRWFLRTQLGYAPWIQRQEGTARVSFWFLVGSDWGGFRQRR